MRAERAAVLAAAGGLAAMVALRIASPERYAALMRRLGLAAPTYDDMARDIVRNAYAATAKGSQSCCVVPSSAKQSSLSYSAAERAIGEATGSDLGLGCGNPIGLAQLQPGESVIDLGSGPGLDCLLAAAAVGPTGRVCGVDMTQEMITKARKAARKAGAANVEFLKGTLEALPLPDGWGDVVVSNCVVNLSPDKVRESGGGGAGTEHAGSAPSPCRCPVPRFIPSAADEASVASNRRFRRVRFHPIFPAPPRSTPGMAGERGTRGLPRAQARRPRRHCRCRQDQRAPREPPHRTGVATPRPPVIVKLGSLGLRQALSLGVRHLLGLKTPS